MSSIVNIATCWSYFNTVQQLKYELLQNTCKYSSCLFSLLFIISLIREYEYVSLFTDEQTDSVVRINYDHIYVFNLDSQTYALLTNKMSTTPMCAQITPGIASISSSQAVGYTITGNKFFKRMGAVPFFFVVNINIYYLMPNAGGVCSLKVDWSC